MTRTGADHTARSIGDIQALGRMTLNRELASTGSEIPVNEPPAGASVPFVHGHKRNEEDYIVLKAKGQFYNDGVPVDAKTSWMKQPYSGMKEDCGMNRRQALRAALGAAGITAALRPGRLAAQTAAGDTIFVNPATGADTNTGSKSSPLRTLAEAARRVNQSSGSGPMTVMLSEGIYAIGETTLLKPERRTFSKTGRLTIRAEVLPGDPEWDTGQMPVLIHTMPLPESWNGRRDPAGGAANGMVVETSHVTILGLKFLGYPLVETPKPGQIRRLYGISRLRRDLEDLEIAQCMFLGDDLTNPLHVAVIATGNEVKVHHCIFRGSKITVVYWSGDSRGHAMTHCFCDSISGSGVWTCGIRDDFEFRNNVLSNCNYAWTWQPASWASAVQQGSRAPGTIKPEEMISYRVVNCHLAGNRRLFGSGVGARQQYADLDPSHLKLESTRLVEQPVIVERDQTKRNYLHPAAGSEASKVGAGLFLKPFA